MHEHLADRAAEGGGGHGEMERNTDPPPRRRQGAACARVSPGAVVVVRAVQGEGLARPVAGSGNCCWSLYGRCSPGCCWLSPAVHGAGQPWMNRPGREARCPCWSASRVRRMASDALGGLSARRTPAGCLIHQKEEAGGRPPRPPLEGQQPLQPRIDGRRTAAPASAGGAHPPPGHRGARGSGC